MTFRSWLFVPGDSEKKLAKVASCGADVVIVDLEDAVAPDRKPVARVEAVRWLNAHRQQVLAGPAMKRWVRINPLDSTLWREDLVTVMAGKPDGIMVPKAQGPEQLRLLSAELYELEHRHGIPTNSTRILPLVSETAAAALTIPAYATEELPRLAGLTWGAEDLSAAVGATRKRDAAGQWTPLFQMVRSQTLLAAHARKVAAIDTLYADFRDLAGLKAVAEASRADGFTGMLAIHPDQVSVINAAFAPSEAEIAEARAIVDLFAANPSAGVLQYEGRMVDQPHLEQARQMLAGLDD
jgi:citrate lyase subunit beta/citryl-CoA lyase